jgi:hypothetical protein
MPSAGTTHDITIEESNERNRRGFMLTRDRRGKRRMRIQDGQTISPRVMSMGEMTQAEFPPELELIWFQENWQAGIGGITHRLNPNSLASSAKIDATEYGKIKLSRELRSTTLNSAPNHYQPSGFAVTQSETTNAPRLWAFIGRDVYSGGDDNWTLATEPYNAAVFYKNGLQYGTDVLAPGWNAGTDLEDSPTPYIYKTPTVANWTLSTENEGQFKYFVKARNSSGDEVVWGGHNITNTGLTLSGDHTNSDTTLTLSGNPTGTIAVNDIVIMGEPGSREMMLVTAISSSDPHLTVVRAYGTDAVDPSGGEKIYLYLPHVVRSSTNITNSGSWSTAVTIGQDDQPITGLIVDGDTDTLLIAKTDGLYSYAADAQVRNLTPLFRQFGHEGNFANMYSWNGHILVPLGHGGLLDFNFETLAIKDISFKVTAPLETALHGKILAMHGDPINLFMVIQDNDTATTMYLLRGNEVTMDDGTTAIRWHNVATLGSDGALKTNRVGLMVDTTLSDHRRVWVGYTEAGEDEVPKFLPFDTLDQTDGYTNDTDAEAVTVKFDANMPRIAKRFAEIEIESANLSAGTRSIAIQYKIDSATQWSDLDTATISPLQTLPFPGGTSGKVLQLKFKPLGSSITTTSPELLSFRVKMQLRPSPSKLLPLTVYLGERQQLLNGAVGGKPKGDLGQLREWDAGANDLILYTPESATARSVVFLPGTLVEEEVALEKGRSPEYRVSFTLAEV